MMNEEKEKDIRLKKLNAGGDNSNLTDNGNNWHYWYSINDTMALLLHTRQEILQYNNQVAQGEEFLVIRQNQNGGIFLTDPYHTANFMEYFNDDISRIIGNHPEEAHNNQVWECVPKLIVIPLLSGMNWPRIEIQINYETNTIDIVWDDPYGKFPEQLKQNLLESLKIIINQLTWEKMQMQQLKQILIYYSIIMRLINRDREKMDGIADLSPSLCSNNNLTEIYYTISDYNSENHENTIKDIRINQQTNQELLLKLELMKETQRHQINL